MELTIDTLPDVCTLKDIMHLYGGNARHWSVKIACEQEFVDTPLSSFLDEHGQTSYALTRLQAFRLLSKSTGVTGRSNRAQIQAYLERALRPDPFTHA